MITRAVSLEHTERLKKAKPAIYAAIEEVYQRGEYTERERQLIRKLRDLGNWQLEAACSWFEFDLMRGPHDMDYLEGVVQQWEQIPPKDRPTISLEAAEDRLRKLKKEIADKETEVERARREGHFWSIVPLLEYYSLGEEERGGTSFYPLLPFFMQRAYERMQNPRKQKPGLMQRLKRFRIGISQTGDEAEIEIHDLRDSDR